MWKPFSRAARGYRVVVVLAWLLGPALGTDVAWALDLPAKDTGFVTAAGGSSKGDGPVAKYNYSVGYELHWSDGAPPPPLVAMDRKNYLVFDLSGVSEPIIAATLKIWSGTLESAARPSWAVWWRASIWQVLHRSSLLASPALTFLVATH